MKEKVLFVCVHNSARSQIAEAWLNHLCPDEFEATSAGLQPGVLNPLAVEAMREIGIDISAKQTRAVANVLNEGQKFSYVITVCDESEADGCPVFPGVATRLHWPFADPSELTGTNEEKLNSTREIRDQIRERIERWCAEVCTAR